MYYGEKLERPLTHLAGDGLPLYLLEKLLPVKRMSDDEVVPIGRRSNKRKKETSSNTSISLLDEEIERLARELEESESSDEDEEETGEEETEEVVEETRKDEDFGHALILSTPYYEKDRIQPLHSSALPSNSCKTKMRGSASEKVERKQKTTQWYVM